MSLKTLIRGSKSRQIVPWGGARVVSCSYQATDFFTGRESDSRLTVSLVTHREARDVFA